ncbi:kinase-like domain-containing protein [Dichomitus squalens]|uniref:Kinase-like domain-containing protein n=1 Tax=Dichomitus squalens TaxID=114155 RepID=A0A4Q9N570_9APHY|nr:kinase-like domain-containing protein [Dichomitus squalens]
MSTRAMPNFTGCVIARRYELVQQLGRGGFGVVYQALDHGVVIDSDEQYVAVKIMQKAGRSEADLAALKNEVVLHGIATTCSDGVVQLIDAFEDDAYSYIILELCRGGDLYDHITKNTYQGNDELLRRAFISLVDAVQAIHDAKIAHRDLKPANVLSNEDGSELYLADFGMATTEPVISEFGHGTSHFMSLECIGELTAQQPYDPYLSDIWAMGVILFAMITRTNPWSKATIKDDDFCEFLMDPDYLFFAHPISSGAHAIIREMLQPDPTQRISLRNLRQAILSLDTFFRPMCQFEYVVPEHERIIIPPPAINPMLATPQSEIKSTNKAPEIDILDAASGPAARVAQNCSAGSAVDISSTTTSQLGCHDPDCSSCSSSRASSGASDAETVGTPEGIIPTMAINTGAVMMAGTHHKVVRGDHGLQNVPFVPAQVAMAQYGVPQAQYFPIFVPAYPVYYVQPNAYPYH